MEKFVKRPVITLIILAVITGFFFMQMKSKSQMETNLDKYMPQDHPAFIFSDQAEEWFDIKDGII
ncbi:MAG: hypothetical protein HQ562_09250, partial [Candidatus Marinimicrobia bacterium]|nr:hypothetical protein [Candidatus Neomarinimicrobiota bacterium]